MKTPATSEQIAARLADARVKLSDALQKQKTLADGRASAARDGIEALRAHNAKAAETADLVEHLNATVCALESERYAAATAEYESACTEAYEKVAEARATVIERVTHHREKIATMIGELRELVRGAELDVDEINRNLPAGMKRLMPLNYELRREPRGMIIGVDDPDYWFFGENSRAPAKRTALKLVRPAKPNEPSEGDAPPAPKYAPGCEPGMKKFVMIQHPPESNAVSEERPASGSEKRAASGGVIKFYRSTASA